MKSIKNVEAALVLAGIISIILGVLLILKLFIPFEQDITAISIVNTIIIPIIGLFPLATAIMMHLDRIKSENNYKILKALAHYWIYFASICLILVLVLNFIY